MQARVLVRKLGVLPDAGSLLARLHPLGAVLFDSGGGGRFGRTSMLALPWRSPWCWSLGDAKDPFAHLAQELAAAPRVDACGLPLPGGFVVLLSYELRRILEVLPARHARITRLPDMMIMESRVVLQRDEATGEGLLCCVDDGTSAAALRSAEAAVLRALDTVSGEGAFVPRGPRRDPDRAAHLRRVAAAREHIRAGDIYQANLAQVWRWPRPADTVACYRALRRANPPTFGAYLEAGGEALLSLSPERFLRTDGDVVSTRPIKGTAPRGASAAADERSVLELSRSVKDRAELAMIVDILRNDLSRVCRAGSVEVSSPMEVERHPSVHHLVAEICGRLRPGETLCSLLRATLPGGSITGAPRIRAMEIIDALEDSARGPYCGSLGWIGYDGASDWNILIRTAFTAGDELVLHAGGGIVLDSDPELEERETRHKLAALMSVLQ